MLLLSRWLAASSHRPKLPENFSKSFSKVFLSPAEYHPAPLTSEPSAPHKESGRVLRRNLVALVWRNPASWFRAAPGVTEAAKGLLLLLNARESFLLCWQTLATGGLGVDQPGFQEHYNRISIHLPIFYSDHLLTNICGSRNADLPSVAVRSCLDDILMSPFILKSHNTEIPASLLEWE